jgi:hypothetical protein
MKVKKEYLLLILIIGVLSIYLLVQKTNNKDPDLPKLAQLDDSTVNRIVIAKSETSIELSKADERWLIQPDDYPADTTKVKNIINAAAKLTATALVSEAGIYERYGLDAAKRTTVKVFNGKELQREFSIGREAPTFQHTFVMLADDPNVYHARGNLTGTFNQTVDGLRDKKIIAFDKARITGIDIRKGEQSRTLAKKEIVPEVPEKKSDDQADPSTSPQPTIKWSDTDGQVVETKTVDSLLNTMSGLVCDQFMADDAKAALTDPAWTLTFNTGQESYTFSVFDKDDQTPPKYQASASTSRFAFLLAESRVQNIEKTLDTLLKASSDE